MILFFLRTAKSSAVLNVYVSFVLKQMISCQPGVREIVSVGNPMMNELRRGQLVWSMCIYLYSFP